MPCNPIVYKPVTREQVEKLRAALQNQTGVSLEGDSPAPVTILGNKVSVQYAASTQTLTIQVLETSQIFFDVRLPCSIVTDTVIEHVRGICGFSPTSR